jgi:hypothetical protein
VSGWKIALALIGLFAGAAVYLVWPEDTDLRRAYDGSAEHKQVAQEALRACGELLHYIEERKPAAKKKFELAMLREKFEQLGVERDELLESSEAMQREERLQALADMEGRFFQLSRSCEDLRARLREMKSFLDELVPLIARLGRLQHALIKKQNESGDPLFNQQSAKLIENSKSARSLADKGMQELSVSIVRGRPLSQAALNDLREIIGFMRELLGDDAPPEPSAPAGASGAATGDRAPAE